MGFKGNIEFKGNTLEEVLSCVEDAKRKIIQTFAYENNYIEINEHHVISTDGSYNLNITSSKNELQNTSKLIDEKAFCEHIKFKLEHLITGYITVDMCCEDYIDKALNIDEVLVKIKDLINREHRSVSDLNESIAAIPVKINLNPIDGFESDYKEVEPLENLIQYFIQDFLKK